MRTALFAVILAASASPAIPALAQTVTITPGTSDGSTTDPLNGATVTANSALLPGFSAQDAFGSMTSGGTVPESRRGGTVIFADGRDATGFIDFRTTSAVTLAGIDVFIRSDGTDPFRAFNTVRLFGGASADVLASLGSATTPGAGPFTVNFAFDVPTSLQFFRFEGTNFTEGGARLLEIDGIAAGSGSAVPEPASWALMIGGMGAVAGAMRGTRRRKGALATL